MGSLDGKAAPNAGQIVNAVSLHLFIRYLWVLAG